MKELEKLRKVLMQCLTYQTSVWRNESISLFVSKMGYSISLDDRFSSCEEKCKYKVGKWPKTLKKCYIRKI